ncbi:MAG: MarR family transcriptional regulator [Tissierellaceae bacterium]
MERLEKLSESYDWIEKIAGRTVIELLKTKDMLEEVHDRFFEEYDLSNTKFNILVILYRGHKEEPMYMSQIGERMLLSNANITGLTDRLEKQDYVRRVRSSEDRRKIVVEITKKGVECVERVIEDYIVWSGKLMDPLKESEKNQFVEILKKLQLGIMEMEKQTIVDIMKNNKLED